MKYEILTKCVTVVVAVCLAWTAVPAAAENEEYSRPINRTEFVVGVYAAIIGQVRETVDPNEALVALQDRGLVEDEWDGTSTITLGEADEIFSKMGIQVFIEDEDVLLNSGRFEQILRTHEGEIKKIKQHWDIIHGFSMGLELGEYRGRIIDVLDGGGEPPISPSGF